MVLSKFSVTILGGLGEVGRNYPEILPKVSQKFWQNFSKISGAQNLKKNATLTLD